MADQQYDVVFKGALVTGASPELVKAKLAKLFKTEPAKLDHLFSGKTVTIKKGLDRAGADKYEAVLRRAGAIVDIIEMQRAESAAPEPDSVAPAPQTAAPPQAPADLTVAEVGVTLVESAPVKPAEFDTTHLNLAEVGVDLVEDKPVEAPEYDLSGFSLDPPGVDLDERKPPKKAEFDTSGLSLSDPP